VWLIIDCLPAAEILAGGVTALKAAQVVCARSPLANRAELCDQMRTAGWIEAAWAESQHPAFGHAWFTRDTALELDNAAKRQAELVAERDALAQSCASETQAKEFALQERDSLSEAKTALQTQLEALEKAMANAQAQLGINSQEQSDLQGQLSAITQAKVDLQSKLESAAKRQAELVAERDALAKAKEAETAAKNKAVSERDVLAKEKQTEAAKNRASQERLQELEGANQDLQNRQHLQHEELVKAEAQIELIKDLLLREQGI
jgi:chromosome segregation ATPase